MENGRRRSVSKLTAAAKTTVAKALKGDLRAMAIVIHNTATLSAPDVGDADLQSDIDRLIVSDFAKRGDRNDSSP